MITDDHPWSSPTIFQIENHRLVERLRWLKLTLRLSPVFRSIFSRRMSISWWALSSSSWVFSWAIWYLPAAPWVAWNEEKKRKTVSFKVSPAPSQVLLWACPSRQRTCPSPRSCATRPAGSCQTPPERKALLRASWIWSYHWTLPEYSHFPIACSQAWREVCRSRLAISQPRERKINNLCQFDHWAEIEGYWCCRWSELAKVFTVHPWSQKGYWDISQSRTRAHFLGRAVNTKWRRGRLSKT